MQNIKNHKSLFFITKNEIILEATKNKIFKIKDNLKIVVFLIVKILPLIHILFYLFIVFICNAKLYGIHRETVFWQNTVFGEERNNVFIPVIFNLVQNII